eukprot:1150904-Pelagomonas_calceolata.AAC.1
MLQGAEPYTIQPCCKVRSLALFNHAARCRALHHSTMLQGAEPCNIQPCCKVRSLALFNHA